MKALFIGCHCDDIELGCGGTIHKRKNDWNIFCAVFSECGPFGSLKELKNYSKKSLEELGANEVIFDDFPTNDFWQYRQKIWEKIHELEKSINPDIIFTQCPDNHQDHKTIYEESVRNFKKKDMISYQSSIRNSLDHSWNWFEVLNRSDVDAKINILKNFPCYKDTKIYFTPENIESQLRINAMYIESEFAEAFKLIKKIN
jgi:LmbE family N-acetylglucosaminyl deacetylase